MEFFGISTDDRTVSKDSFQEINNIPASFKEKSEHDVRYGNLSDDILFALAMQNEELCRLALSMLLEREVYDIEYSHIQKSIQNMPGYKSIRLDAYVRMSDGLYCIEMQKLNNDCIPKRSRFYQGLLDVTNLYAGKEIKYTDLKKTIIIFIGDFDLWGYDRMKYSFTYKCNEIPGLELGDDTEKIFINLSGTTGDEGQIFRAFLRYIKDSTTENAEDYSVLSRFNKQFQNYRNSEKVREKYMRDSWMRESGIEEGLAKGRAEGINAFIVDKLEDYVTKDIIISKLQKRFNLSEYEAENYYNKAISEYQKVD